MYKVCGEEEASPFEAIYRRERLDWAERHKEYTLEDLERVVWSDETKINHIGLDGTKRIWKEVGGNLTDRQVEGTLKFGGGDVMMWGCMFQEGVGYVTRIERENECTTLLPHPGG